MPTFSPSIIPINAAEIPNPGRGLYRWRGNQYICMSDLASNRDAYQRWNWRLINPSAGVFDWSPVEAMIAQAKTRGQRSIIGLALTCGSATYAPYLPEYMINEAAGWGMYFEGTFYPNWNHPEVQAIYQAMIESFVARFAGDGRISMVTTVVYGRFGEGYLPWNAPPTHPMWATEATARWMIDCWHDRITPHFTTFIDLFNRYTFHYAMTKTPKWGWKIDSVGFQPQVDKIDVLGASAVVINGVAIGDAVRNRWKYAPVIAETMADYTDPAFDRSQVFQQSREQVVRYHMSLLCNGNFMGIYNTPPYKPIAGVCTPQASSWTQANIDEYVLAGKLAGYRYAVASCTVSPAAGTITTIWQNHGNAPMYDAWPVQFELRTAGGSVAWSGTSSVNLRTILPDSPVTITDTSPALAALAVGTYSLHLLAPAINVHVQPLRFAIDGRQADASYLLGSVEVAAVITPPPPPPPPPVPAPTTVISRGSIVKSGTTGAVSIPLSTTTLSTDTVLAWIATAAPTDPIRVNDGWELVRREVLSPIITIMVWKRIAPLPTSFRCELYQSASIIGGVLVYRGAGTPIVGAVSGTVNQPALATPIATAPTGGLVILIGATTWKWGGLTPPTAMKTRAVFRPTRLDLAAFVSESASASIGGPALAPGSISGLVLAITIPPVV